jgi:hypothetical protein
MHGRASCGFSGTVTLGQSKDREQTRRSFRSLSHFPQSEHVQMSAVQTGAQAAVSSGFGVVAVGQSSVRVHFRFFFPSAEHALHSPHDQMSEVQPGEGRHICCCTGVVAGDSAQSALRVHVRVCMAFPSTGFPHAPHGPQDQSAAVQARWTANMTGALSNVTAAPAASLPVAVADTWNDPGCSFMPPNNQFRLSPELAPPTFVTFVPVEVVTVKSTAAAGPLVTARRSNASVNFAPAAGEASVTPVSGADAPAVVKVDCADDAVRPS